MCKKIKYICIIILLAVIQIPLHAQDKKPKVALVLSGGGAKGVAHITLLQKLDSLGIVPDLVVGTSMGSIVGGLYAMGYSGNDINDIMNDIDWSELLGGRVTLAKVGNEEKSEFNRYLLDLNWENKKPSINAGLLNDQNLRELLALLTYPAYGINDFDDLPIPYRAIATDLVNGEEVVIKDGSLLTAMRASMSIPSVFKPVEYKETLLIDGGILNNFPTDVAKKMGADIIIGSDVGGGLSSKEELNNIVTILFQTSMMVSNAKNQESRVLCDILIDHIPNLTYSTGDFNHSSAIYEEGKIAINSQSGVLEELAVELKPFKQRVHKLPEAPEAFKLDTIVYKRISKGNLDLVKSRTDFKKDQLYTPEDIVDGVNNAMGTNLFNQIVVFPTVKDSLVGLEINGIENSSNQVKLALHYNTYRGVGVIINYTGRNLLGDASRTLVTLDVAEQPKLRIQHQQIFGEAHMWWWRTELLLLKLKQKVYYGNYSVDGLNSNSLFFDADINRNLIPNKSYIGLGIDSHRVNLNPKIDLPSDEALVLERYKYNTIGIDFHFNYNSLSEVFYPKRGTFVHAVLDQSLVSNVNLTFSDDINNLKGSTNSYTKANIVYERRILVKPKLSVIIGYQGAFIFEQDLKGNDISFNDFGYAANYFVGGDIVRAMPNTYKFYGLNEDELAATQFMALSLGFQYNPFNNIYVQPHTSLGSVGFNDFSPYIKTAFSPNGSWTEAQDTSALFSAGLTFAYASILGPINLDVSYVNDIDKLRVFLGIGIELGRSN